MNIAEYFVPKYEGCTFVVYPYALSYENAPFGELTPHKIWHSLVEKMLGLVPHQQNEHICVFRDIEYNAEKKRVVQKCQIGNVVLHGRILVIMRETVADHETVPKISCYHDEFDRCTKTYIFGTVKLNFVSIGEKYHHIEMVFTYTGKKSTLKQDIAYVENILAGT